MNPETLQKCSTCGCKKLLKFFKIRGNTGEYYKTCNECCEKYKCNKCDYKCPCKSSLTKHIKQVHDKIKDNECPECDFKCSTNGHLQRHIKSVHDKIKDYECPECDFKCCVNSSLSKHIKQVHDKLKDHECTECDFKCSTNQDLQKHIKRVHDKIKDFKCSKCNYKCSSNDDLQKHIKRVHDKIKDFECPKCSFKTCTNGDLTVHIKICTGTNTSISGLELRCIEALTDLGFEQDYEYVYNNTYYKLTDWCGKRLRPDFRLVNHKIIIETDGSQHYKPKAFGSMSQEQAETTFKLIQENDKLKDDFCKEFGYKMVRISYKDISNILSILHNELQDILDF